MKKITIPTMTGFSYIGTVGLNAPFNSEMDSITSYIEITNVNWPHLFARQKKNANNTVVRIMLDKLNKRAEYSYLKEKLPKKVISTVEKPNLYPNKPKKPNVMLIRIKFILVLFAMIVMLSIVAYQAYKSMVKANQGPYLEPVEIKKEIKQKVKEVIEVKQVQAKDEVKKK